LPPELKNRAVVTFCISLKCNIPIYEEQHEIAIKTRLKRIRALGVARILA
jgi:hypothetical protein